MKTESGKEGTRGWGKTGRGSYCLMGTQCLYEMMRIGGNGQW